MDSQTSRFPNHIAIILDGNRRYAKKMGMPLWRGHYLGVKKVTEFMEWCRDLGIKELTLYCFSTENFKRSRKEVAFLFRLFNNEFNSMRSRKNIFKHKIKINMIGRSHMLPDFLRKSIREIAQITKNHKMMKWNILL